MRGVAMTQLFISSWPVLLALVCVGIWIWYDVISERRWQRSVERIADEFRSKLGRLDESAHDALGREETR